MSLDPLPSRPGEDRPGEDRPGADAFKAWQKRRRFGALDGLRGLCILAVLWHHSPTSLLPGPILAPVLTLRGFLGVDFFFVLSGFLITTLLLREEARLGRFSLAGFYLRRAIRIWPVYYLVLGLATLWAVLGRGESEALGLVPFYLLFLANFLTREIGLLGPTWSLSVEEQFYLLWPLALWLVPRRWIGALGVALVGLNLAGISGVFGTGPQIGPLRFSLPNATYAPILLGALLALILADRRGHGLVLRHLGGRWTGLVLAGLIPGLAALLPADLRGWPNLALHLTMTACLAALVVNETSPFARALRFAPLARLGAVSYGVYLYHLFALTLVNRLMGAGANPWIVLPAYGILSWILAEISFRSFETWFQRFRPRDR